MKKILSVVLSLIILSSCSYKFTPSTSAMINVTNYEVGDLNKLKTGESCSKTILFFPEFDSSTSVIDAMRDGGISKIKMIDRSFFSALLYSKTCTIVHGY